MLGNVMSGLIRIPGTESMGGELMAKKKLTKQKRDNEAGTNLQQIGEVPDVDKHRQAWDIFRRLESHVVRSTTGLVGESADLVEDGGSWVQDQIIEVKDGTIDLADDVLTLLHTNPQKDAHFSKSVTEFVLTVLPIVGNTSDYTVARQTYERGLECSDPKEREALFLDARRTCVMALVGMDLEVATMGAAGAVPKILTIASRASTALALTQTLSKVVRSASPSPGSDKDTKTRIADALLKVPLISIATDRMLTI